MRTIAVMTIIGLVVCGSLMAEEVAKEQSQDLLKKAGQEAFSRYEKQLEEKKAEIDNYIREISSDGVVSSKDMLGLREKVDSFNELKKEATKHLKIYGLQVNIELSKEVTEIVDKYFLPFLRRGDKDGSVRMLFAKITGQDLRIESRFLCKAFLILVGLTVLGAILFIVGAVIDNAVIGAPGCVSFVVCLLIIIVGLSGT